MLTKPLLLATFIVFSMSASCRAATMSSDAGDSGMFGPPPASLGEITAQAEVETQADAYFAPPGADSATSESDDGFMTVEEEQQRRRKAGIAWMGSGLALAQFFSYNSDLPDTDASSFPLEPGPGVAPVPELNSGMLVLLAIFCLGTMGVGRKKLVKRTTQLA